MAAIDVAWEDIKSSFGLEDQQNSFLKPLSSTTISFLKEEDLLEGVLEYLHAEVEQRLRMSVAPSFWRHFQNLQKNEDETEMAARFQTAVNDLSVNSLRLLPMVNKMDELAATCDHKINQFGRSSYQDIFWLFLKGTLHSQLPNQDYRKPIWAFYGRAFHVFNVRRDGGNISINRYIFLNI